MAEVTTESIAFPGTSRGALAEILKAGAQRMLAQAIEAEVAEWIDAHADVTDAAGRRQVLRNGYLPERKIVTGVGEIPVRQPRVTTAGRTPRGRSSRRRSCRRTCGSPRTSRN